MAKLNMYANKHLDNGKELATKDDIAFQYSTNEIKTNEKWIDGRDIYFKVVELGNLTNASEKTVNLNINNFDKIVKPITGVAMDSQQQFPLPFVSEVATSSIKLFVRGEQIAINSGSMNRSSYVAWAFIYYVKKQ